MFKMTASIVIQHATVNILIIYKYLFISILYHLIFDILIKKVELGFWNVCTQIKMIFNH